MRTSAIAVNNFKLGQPHVVHRLSAAWSTDLGECDNVAPLTHDLRKASMNPMAISRALFMAALRRTIPASPGAPAVLTATAKVGPDR